MAEAEWLARTKEPAVKETRGRKKKGQLVVLLAGAAVEIGLVTRPFSFLAH